MITDLNAITLDQEQQNARNALEVLFNQEPVLVRSWFSRFFRPSPAATTPPPIDGVYLYGPAGRGKTMLMDYFFQNSPIPNNRRRRVHYHDFMYRVHERLHTARRQDLNASERAKTVGQELATELDLLCFDEFHVTDVANAMLLHPLMSELIRAGVKIVITSNWAPNDLYKDGLQRERFLPFIKLLQDQFDVVPLETGIDYRKRALKDAPRWLSPLNRSTAKKFQEIFKTATDGHEIRQAEIQSRGSESERSFKLDKTAGSILYLDMPQFLDRSLGANDYSMMVEKFDLFFLDNLTSFKRDQSAQAKRLITLIDLIYDRGLDIFVRSNGEPDSLYTHKSPVAFEFERTVSRLFELRQSS